MIQILIVLGALQAECEALVVEVARLSSERERLGSATQAEREQLQVRWGW